MLKWSNANAKTEGLASVPSLQQYLQDKRKVYSVDILSGWSCPFAEECLSRVKVIDGKKTVVDGKKTKFRCFSASQEVVYPNVYNSRKNNYDLFKGLDSVGQARLIRDTMPKNMGITRIHVGGDFFNLGYMLAWASVAETHPDRLFYAYTKSLPYWLKIRKYVNSLPNFVLTASYGGREDRLIGKHRLRYAKVVFSEQQAKDAGLEIDHDDSHAADPSKQKENFALLIHGTQPKGSEASVALQTLRKNNVKHSYSKGK